MDYKEEYQKALERAKMILCNLPEGSSSERDIETIFPELKESEDERIRKEMIHWLKGFIGGFDVGKNVGEVLKEQKPAEWSEEDKMNLNGCICSLRQYGYMTYADFLKHLPERFNLQPKQEWSEEDENWSKYLLDELYAGLVDYCGAAEKDMRKAIKWFETRIKFLRPQPYWKPSKEQISALEYFIRSWGESCTMSPQNPTLCAAKLLYNDLKKLM